MTTERTTAPELGAAGAALCAKLKYEFQNPSLLVMALTHSSFANEHRAKGMHSNERLEFLGAAILSMLTAEYLYTRFPLLPEAELNKTRAAIVCKQSLHALAEQIGLGEALLLGKGEDANGGRKRPSILADAMEALIAAMYLDGGERAVRKFVIPFLERKTERLKTGQGFKDYKTTLQEIVQKNKQETLSYVLTGESGPDHDKSFHVTLYLNSNPVAVGEGKSKKEAEQHAAKAALELMGQDV